MRPIRTAPKECTNCHVVKELTEYYRSKNSYWGKCKTCSKQTHITQYIPHAKKTKIETLGLVDQAQNLINEGRPYKLIASTLGISTMALHTYIKTGLLKTPNTTDEVVVPVVESNQN